jgi:putative oxidoreductase
MTFAWVFCARLLLVLLFLPFSALDKLLNSEGAVDQAALIVAPRSVARLFIASGFLLEVTLSFAILSGVADRLAAVGMALYCVATAVLWKRFWTLPDFKLKGQSAAREVFWDFLKNLSVAGGFLMLAIGSDGSGVNALLRHPFGSSRPYDPALVGISP